MTPELGIIEGYFGRAWCWDDRQRVITTLAPAGYRFFHYAPKIDTRLRRDWQQLHDPEAAQQVAAFASHCRSLGVLFGLGLTPYGAHLDFDDAAKAAMRAKLRQFADWGIDDLAILFDDMRGDVPDLATRQIDIAHFIAEHSPATRHFFCPSYYTDDPILDRVFGQRPAHYLEDLGKGLDPSFAIYWTGEDVCSAEIGTGHLRDITSRLGRKIALWDNYPVNDGPIMSQHLHLRAFTGRSADNAHHLSHHAINPASQPLLGCIPALTLPMIYDQGDDYRYGVAFVKAATTVCGSELAALLQANMLILQRTGLERLTAEQRANLYTRYQAIDHGIAREIVDWLDGGYAITGEMLQTQ